MSSSAPRDYGRRAKGPKHDQAAIKTDDNTGDITIETDRGERQLSRRMCWDSCSPQPVAAEHPARQRTPPTARHPSSGPFMISKVERAPHHDVGERNPKLQDGPRTQGPPTKWPNAGVDKITITGEQETPAPQVTDIEAEQGRFHGRPGGIRPSARGQDPLRQPISAWRIRSTPTTLLHEHRGGHLFNDQSRCARRSTTPSIPERP